MAIRQVLLRMTLLSSLVATAQPAAAHDMWIAPDDFELHRGQHLRARLLVGEALAPEQSRPYAADRTLAIALHDRAGVHDLRASIHEGADPLIAALSPTRRGQQLLEVRRDWASIALPADRFVEYLDHEGLAGVLDGRAPLVGEQRERYRRSLKALVRVGRGHGGDLHARALGHSLEIVLLDAPSKLREGDRLRARLLREGAPLADHPLTAHVRDVRGVVASQSLRTDVDGTATFVVPGESVWLLRTVHVSPCDGCTELDWQSDWTAFAFAVGS